ncbi:MAG: ISAs1 family transposase [Oscillospiraceae bacterium]|nr:ISAs1 family transposase [Oscillospiraceae bacterium]
MPTPLVKIREIIKDIRFDARVGKMPKAVLKRIVSCMECVGDGRVQGMICYPLPYILLLAFLAVLSGAEHWTDMQDFSSAYKKKLNGIFPQYKSVAVPSHDTFRRVFGIISTEELQGATSAFLVQEISQMKKALGIEDDGLRHLGLDGKEQKGTGRKYGTDQKVANLQTLHCYDISNGICLHSKPIDGKTNEIPVAQQLLAAMNLKNCVVTFDALNTQRGTVDVIAGGGGHYVGGLKGNHQLFHDEVALFFSDEELANIRKKGKYFRSYTEKAHNRIEKRSYYMTTDIKWFADLHKWAGLKAFICYVVETEDLVSGKKTKELRYYIASLADIELCSDAIRSHWGIENQLHWHLDVTFSEDDNTTMDKNAFNNLSIMNKMALSLLKLIQPAHKAGIRRIRRKFGWDLTGHLTQLLNLLDEDQIEQALLNSL